MERESLLGQPFQIAFASKPSKSGPRTLAGGSDISDLQAVPPDPARVALDRTAYSYPRGHCLHDPDVRTPYAAQAAASRGRFWSAEGIQNALMETQCSVVRHARSGWRFLYPPSLSPETREIFLALKLRPPKMPRELT